MTPFQVMIGSRQPSSSRLSSSSLSCSGCRGTDSDRNTLSVPALKVIKGDQKCASIAAASILAKVTRDRYMLELDKLYPQYGFAKHKGYGTAAHYAALREYGPSPVHRPAYLRKMH